MGASKFEQLMPLPAVPQELAMIQRQGFSGQMFLDEQFTLANLMQQQRQTHPGILHLATHADFNSGAPQNSFIQFHDQRLTLDKIDRLGLRDSNLELLILSACNTATGDPSAELGFTGMASLFGVRTAIGSLWSVSDLGTLAFMSEFYGRLAQTPSRADALRQTQLAMQQGQVRLVGGKLRTSNATFVLPQALQNSPDSTFTHPYYWSGFTMVGNPW
jgi:CHAT domain-containing protein